MVDRPAVPPFSQAARLKHGAIERLPGKTETNLLPKEN